MKKFGIGRTVFYVCVDGGLRMSSRRDTAPASDEAQVHVVDDDAAVRDSLEFLLQSAGLPTCLYATADAFLAAAPSLRSGCVLTDIRMPGTDGLALQSRLAEMGCPLPVIVMTGHGDVPLAVRALKTGALDFLEKPFDDEQLLRIVRQALKTSEATRAAAESRAQIVARLQTLTPREKEVLDRLIDGQPNKTIAFDLGTSPRTVEVQRARVMEKMGARSLPDLVRMGMACGIVRAPD
jgi:two-component system response regulator FixJ